MREMVEAEEKMRREKLEREYFLNPKEKAELKNMKYSDKGISFIRSGGDLCIYSKNKLAIIDGGAYNIIAY